MFVQLELHDDIEAGEGGRHEFDPATWLTDEKYRRHVMLELVDDCWDLARHNEPTELE